MMFNYNTAEYVLGKVSYGRTILEIIWIPFDDIFCRGVHEDKIVDRQFNRIELDQLRSLGGRAGRLADRYERFEELMEEYNNQCPEEDYEKIELTLDFLRQNGFRVRCNALAHFLTRQRIVRAKLRQAGIRPEDLENLGYFQLSHETALELGFI